MFSTNRMLSFLKVAVVFNLIIPFLFVTVPWGLGPEGDAMDYRMSFVRWIFEHKALPSFPWTYNDDYPPLGEILMALSMALGEWGPRFVSALAYSSFVLATVRVAQCFLPAIWTWMAALIVASMNLITTQDNLLMVDLLASSFTVWGMVGFFRFWLNKEGHSVKKLSKRPLVGMGVALGFALLTRYTQLIPVVVLSAFHGVLVLKGLVKRRFLWSEALALVAAVAIPAAVIFAPWLIRNFIENQNPFFPLLTQIWGGKNFDSLRAVEVAYGQRNYGVGASIIEFILLPLNLVRFKNAFDYSAGPFYLLFLPWWILLSFYGGRKWTMPLALLGALTLAWFLTSQQTRFLMYAMPLVVVLGLASVVFWNEKVQNQNLYRYFIILFTLIGIGGTAKHVIKHKSEAFDLKEALQGSPQWKRSIQVPQLDAIAWLNAHLSSENKSVIILERSNNVAFLNVPYLYIYPHFYSTSLYDHRRYQNPDDFYDDLKKSGVLYLYSISKSGIDEMPLASNGQSPWKNRFSSNENGAQIYSLERGNTP